jgi:hypothetical protein
MLVVLPMGMLAAETRAAGTTMILGYCPVFYITGFCDQVATGEICIKTLESLAWNALL